MRDADRSWWDEAADELVAAGIDQVFALPGDDMLALGALDARGVGVVLAHSQRTAVHMALGYAATTRGVGVVVVGRGPGIAGALGAMLEAATGSTPLVVLSGGAPLGEAHPQTFQYAPQLELVRPLCRSAVRVETSGEVRARVAQSLLVAAGPPAGVAYVELPDPPQDDPPRAQVSEPAVAVTRPARAHDPGAVPPPPVLREARRPVILAGGGCQALPRGALTAWSQSWGAPVVCTASGRGVADEHSDLYLGVAGLYLHPEARRVLADADVVVTLGTRLEDTATIGLPVAPQTIQVNVEVADFDVSRPGALVQADVRSVVGHWARPDAVDAQWTSRVLAAGGALQAWAQERVATNPVAAVVSAAVAGLPPGSTFCQENGLMDIWSYLFPVTRLPPEVDMIVPSEQTTLGFGCAAAVGARHARRGDGGVVLVVTGDGAAATLGQDLDAPAPGARGVVLVVLDNAGFGWLEAQDRRVNGVHGRFVDIARPRLASAAVAQVTISPGDVATVRAAVAGVASGEIRVVRVPCSLEDGPPVVDDVW
ncbi:MULTISPECIES: thiamine pyrophosphate-binding protein [Cellulomonas]|uniref:Acetolactate synthase n=3 Tax=Cellulomonas TaxID=1707 RepID=A0A4Y3KP86_9CELL|nr:MULTISPECIES: thiamine pyrophosphate-binding protein [Cellulomonas]MCR6704992.1 thiamine pyrophosphate-binding protein [Cellulomonas sp.]GEA85757.1 hypothetical protein CGE01nite_30080 [Cellulomonas gelida]GGL39119.1 hypothetical protein GCM10009774_32350 [Cellulomonas gelida]